MDEPHNTSRRIHVICKGDKAEDPRLRETILSARKRGHKISVSVTWEAGDASRFATEAASQGIDTVVAVGGDGTINEVVAGVLATEEQTNCAVATIPMGTANDFATSLGIPANDPESAFQLILDSPAVPIDIGKVNDLPFINVASGGVGAEIVAQTPGELKNMLGGVSYSLTGLAKILNLTPRPLTIRGPEWDWAGDAYVLAVGNGRTAGGGYMVARDAKLNDGLLDVLLIPVLSAEEFFKYVGELLELHDGTNLKEIVRCQVPWLEVEAPDGLQVNVDGEPLSAKHFRYELWERRLPFHLPPGAPLLGTSTL